MNRVYKGGGKYQTKSYFDHVTNLVPHTGVAGLRRRESQLHGAGKKELI